MQRKLAVLGVLCMVLVPGIAPAADKQPKDIRVLLVLGSPAAHDIRKFAPCVEPVLNSVGGLKVTRLEPPADKKPDDPAHMAKLADIRRSDYDVLVFYTSYYQLNDKQEQALQKFVEDGGGIVAIHGASMSFQNSDTWFKLVGARFTKHAKGTHPLEVVPTDIKHPVTAGVGPFTIIDEDYQHNFANVERTVLVRFKARPPESDPKANPDIIWIREVGKGRMAYIGLGHNKDAWENPAWQKIVVQSIYWAGGQPREAKLPVKSDKP